MINKNQLTITPAMVKNGVVDIAKCASNHHLNPKLVVFASGLNNLIEIICKDKSIKIDSITVKNSDSFIGDELPATKLYLIENCPAFKGSNIDKSKCKTRGTPLYDARLAS